MPEDASRRVLRYTTRSGGETLGAQEQRDRQQAQPDGEQRQVDQPDPAHVAGGSAERRRCRRVGQVGFGTVVLVVPAVVPSHPDSVAHGPKGFRSSNDT